MFAVLCMKSDAFDKRHVPHAKKYATQFSFALLSQAPRNWFRLLYYLIHTWEVNVNVVYNAFVCHLHILTHSQRDKHQNKMAAATYLQ